MSAQETPVTYRSERAVAADAVWALFEVGLLPKTPEMVARVARATSLRPGDLREARWRREGGRTTQPRDAVVIDREWDTEVARQKADACKAPHRPNVGPAIAARRIVSTPEPGRRRCSRCHEVKPEDDFAIKDRRVGSRKSMCRPCMRVYQRIRYLSVEKVKLMNVAGLRFTICESDNVTGLVCTKCSVPVRAGDEVEADAALRHTVCPVRPMPMHDAHRPRVTAS